jgi:hypothetical protein
MLERCLKGGRQERVRETRRESSSRSAEKDPERCTRIGHLCASVVYASGHNRHRHGYIGQHNACKQPGLLPLPILSTTNPAPLDSTQLDSTVWLPWPSSVLLSFCMGFPCLSPSPSPSSLVCFCASPLQELLPPSAAEPPSSPLLRPLLPLWRISLSTCGLIVGHSTGSYALLPFPTY